MMPAPGWSSWSGSSSADEDRAAHAEHLVESMRAFDFVAAWRRRRGQADLVGHSFVHLNLSPDYLPAFGRGNSRGGKESRCNEIMATARHVGQPEQVWPSAIQHDGIWRKLEVGQLHID